MASSTRPPARRSNFRARAAAASLAGLLLAVSGCSTEEARFDDSLERGIALLDRGDYTKAALELKTALQLQPSSAEARFQLGRLAEKRNDVRAAGEYFQGALDANPDHLPAREQLARLYVLGALPERALEVIKPGLQKNPKHAGLLAMRAAARTQLRDVVGATQDAVAAHREDPKHVEATMVLASLYGMNARSDLAQKTLEEGVKLNPKNTDLRVALAKILDANGSASDAERQLVEVSKLEPNEFAHQARLAMFYVAKSRDADAERVLRAAVERAPASADARSALAAFLLPRRGFESVEQELRRVASRMPNDPAPLFELGALLEAANQPERALALYRDLAAQHANDQIGTDAMVRLAASTLAAGRFEDAQKLVDGIVAKNPKNGSALAVRAQLRVRAGDAAGAVSDLRAALRDQPESAPLLRELAKAHVATGEWSLAEETFRRAVDASGAAFDDRFALAGFLVARGQTTQARPMLERLANEQPGNLQVQQALFGAAAAAGDLAMARSAASAIASIPASAGLGDLYSGMVAEAENRLDEALRLYRKFYEHQPQSFEVLGAVPRILVRTGRAAEAGRFLDEATRRTPEIALPWSLRGDFLRQTGKPAEAEQSYRKAISIAPTWSAPYEGLAKAASAKGDRAGAERLLREALDKVDAPNTVRAELATLAEQSGRPDEAIKEYEAILKSAPQSTDGRVRLAVLLATYRTAEPDIRRAGELVSAFEESSDPAQLDALGWVRAKQGRNAEALNALQRAYRAAPQSPLVRYHLGMAELASGDTDAAREHLRAAVSGGAVFPGAAGARQELARIAAN